MKTIFVFLLLLQIFGSGTSNQLLKHIYDRICHSRFPNSHSIDDHVMTCKCNSGFKISEDRLSCVRLINSTCSNCENGNCDDDGNCIPKSEFECYTRFSCMFSAGWHSYCADGRCVCNPGYEITGNGGRCQEKNRCQYSYECGVKYGAHAHCRYDGKCECKVGYEFSKNGEECQKQDNVEESRCKYDYECLTTYGAHAQCNPDGRCVCSSGYAVAKSGDHCQKSQEVTNGGCRNNNECITAYGAHTQCDSTGRCVCEPGFSPNHLRTECEANAVVSETCESNVECYVKIGFRSFCSNHTCRCVNGYEKANNGRCERTTTPERCTDSVHCQKIFDVNSFCNIFKECECSQGYWKGVDGVQKCITKEKSTCQMDDDCQKRIGVNSQCQDLICVCSDGHEMVEEVCVPTTTTKKKLSFVSSLSATSLAISITLLVVFVLLLLIACGFFVCTRCYKQRPNGENDKAKLSIDERSCYAVPIESVKGL